MRARSTVLLSMGAALLAAPSATAQDAGATSNERSGAAATCVEKVPEGKARPKLQESFPKTGTSGHVSHLKLVVEHGKGERVLPSGLERVLDADENSQLRSAGFVLPHPDGGAGPTLTTEDRGARATTTVQIPIVPLPEKPGRNELTLPALPIAVARASGELMTLCTLAHTIVVEDPIANVPKPSPKGNPAPRPQREVWTTAKHVAFASLIALVVGALVAWLVSKWLKRPRTAPPPPPPRPPWEVAFEELFDIRNADLIRSGRYAEHFDRVSDTVRKYLGGRYGFEGLESTTREALTVLRQVQAESEVTALVEAFLRQADLVKFAGLTPSAEDCELALSRGEDIVRRTVPAPTSGPIEAAHSAAPPPSDHAGGALP